MSCHRIFAPMAAAALMSAGTQALSQYSPGQWVGDLYLVSDNVKDTSPSGGFFNRMAFIDEKNIVHSRIPSLKEVSDEFPVAHPTYYLRNSSGFWYDDAYYALASCASNWPMKDKDGFVYFLYAFARWQDGKWQFLGRYKYPLLEGYNGSMEDLYYKLDLYSQVTAYPCDNDRFIAVSRFKDLAGDNRPDRSPFSIMSIDPRTKDAAIVRPIYHGIDELRNHMSNPKVFGLAANAYHVVTGKYATIVNPNIGLYWCFSLEKASLTRAGSIFKSIDTEEMLKTLDKGGFTMAVLCVNPEKDGTVLVAASEEAALKGEFGDKWDEVRELLEKNPNLTEKEAEKLLVEHQKRMASRNPYIAWYRIYPENGRVEKLSQPPIGGAHKKSGRFSNLLNLGRADEWRPMPDDSVKMGQLEIKEKKEPTQSKPASTYIPPLSRGYY